MIQPYKAWSQGGQLQGLQRIQPQSYVQLPSRLSFILIIQTAFNWASSLWLYMKPLIRREAINQPMKFSIAFSMDTMLQEVQSTRSNPDHTNPIRQNIDSASLLQTHLPGDLLTSKNGLSNLLSWMGTGQGFKTCSFLESFTHDKQFFSSNLEEMMDIFKLW